ncbi:MAG TPA: formate/nitrite transporter family protein [Polyangiaceae bacterium]|nr:formate/nitrite transporter family protein [Polyangiaceae bacterium]
MPEAPRDDAERQQHEQPVELTPRERRLVEQRSRPRAAVLHETIRLEGEQELHRPVSSLGWSALAAGLSMGFSLVSMGLLRALLPATPWRPLLTTLGYCVGFLIVVLGRQQLFTENSLTPVLPLMQNRDRQTLLRVLRLWGIVLAGNLIGAFVFAVVVGNTAVFSPDVKLAFGEIGREAIEGGFWIHLLRGVFAGWLIALMVWMLPSDGSRAFVVFVTTYVIGVGRLSHVIAGSVETLYLVATARAGWGEYLGHFFVPVLIGNVLGGASLVAALNHAQVASDTP